MINIFKERLPEINESKAFDIQSLLDFQDLGVSVYGPAYEIVSYFFMAKLIIMCFYIERDWFKTQWLNKFLMTVNALVNLAWVLLFCFIGLSALAEESNPILFHNAYLLIWSGLLPGLLVYLVPLILLVLFRKMIHVFILGSIEEVFKVQI